RAWTAADGHARGAMAPARTRRSRSTMTTGRWHGATPGFAQPTTETEATTTVPLVRAGAQCTLAKVGAGACGALEGDPVNCGWISGDVVHSTSTAASTPDHLATVPRAWTPSGPPPPATSIRWRPTQRTSGARPPGARG